VDGPPWPAPAIAPAGAKDYRDNSPYRAQRRRPDRATRRDAAHDQARRIKYKINRRLGVNLWGRAKSPLAKREYGPGQHGQRRKNKPTDFGIQLMAKQKLKGYYGNIGEKQFRKYYEEAVRRKGDTSENLIELLERRLDAVIYRMKLAVTPFAARQFVNHGHVTVNGKRVNIPSYLVKDGDQIEVKEKSKQLAAVLDAVQSSERDVPEYLEIDTRAMRGKFLRAPKLSDVPYPVQMEPNLVVEFYSR
jgi:small subunit ribosomal protein S4